VGAPTRRLIAAQTLKRTFEGTEREKIKNYGAVIAAKNAFIDFAAVAYYKLKMP
jgi:hypothetical protein